MQQRFIIFFLAIVGLFHSIIAQTVQQGMIQEYNEKDKKTPLSGVELNVRSAQSTVSDKDGQFLLHFLTLHPGERVNVRRIEKLGYEIFNKEAVEQWNINPKDPFVIVMCRSDRFKRIRDNYEKVSSESYARQLQKEENALAELKAEGKLKEAEYQKQLMELRENYEKQLDNLANYVDRFSRIDLSELSATEQEIIELVQNGKIDEAIAKYEDLNIVDNLISGIRQRTELKTAMSQLSEIDASMSQSNDSLYAMVDRQIEAMMLVGGSDNNRKIQAILCEIADADTTNVEWLIKTGKFLATFIADYDRALQYYHKTQGVVEATDGNESIEMAIVYNNIGYVYDLKGMYAEGLDYCMKSLDVRRKIFGEEHPDVATCYNNIGVLYDSRGEFDKALECHQKALDIMIKIYGADHPHVATSYINIGSVYDSEGKYEIALDYYMKALTIRINEYGDNSNDVAECYNNIGVTYKSLGEYDKALDYQSKALKIMRRTYGDNHPDVANIYNNIGGIHKAKGEYDKALDFFKKALTIRTQIFGENSLSVANSWVNIGNVYYLEDNYDAALTSYRQALPIQECGLGSQHPDVAITYNNIGLVYSAKEDNHTALDYYQKALAIQQQLFGENNHNVATTYNNIGTSYLALGDRTKSMEYLQKALAVKMNVWGEEHPDVASSYSNMGFLFKSIGDYNKALECYKKALEIDERILGAEHPEVATFHNNIGGVYYALKDYPSALEHYLKSLAIREKIFGTLRYDVAVLYDNIGSIYDLLGDDAKAVDNWVKELSIRTQLSGEDNLKVKMINVMVFNAMTKLVKDNDAYKDTVMDFLSDKVWTGLVADSGTPAGEKGMSGEYYILEFGDWNCIDNYDLLAKNAELTGKPKAVVVMRDASIMKHEFENRLGMQFLLKKVSPEEKRRVTTLYNQWKRNER